MSKATFPESIQYFELHMKNGEVLPYAEDYDLPAEKGILGDFKRGKKQFLVYEDYLISYIVPFDQISFIMMTDVKVCD